MKRFWIIAGIIVAVVLIGIVLLPFLINVDSFRPQVEKSLSDALGRQVQIGKISASIFSGGAEADNISISDDPAFSKQPFLQASSLKIGLELMPLIFSRRLNVTAITIKNPDIELVSNRAGKWNYSSLGNSAQKPEPKSPQKPEPKGGAEAKTSSSGAASEVSVAKLEIQNGKIRVLQGAGKERSYQNVNLTVSNISVHSAMPFTLTATIPGGGSLDLDGQAGPLDQQDSAKTPLDAKLTLKQANIAALGFAGPGLGGIVDFDGSVKSDGNKLVSSGKATAHNLLLAKGGTPAKPPVGLDYSSTYGLESNTGTLNVNVHTGGSTANASGTVDARGSEMAARVKVEGKNMAVNDVVGLLPALAVTLPAGASLQGGNINFGLNAEGPLDALVITGPVSITNTHLTGFDLASKLGAMGKFTGIQGSSDTLIQTFSSALRVAPEGIRADNILLDTPSIGQLTGAGTVSSDQQLNFKMLLKLTNGGGMLGQLASVSSSVKTNGIPFTIEGTSSHPVFRPTAAGVAGMLSNLTGTQQPSQGQQKPGVGSILNGLLNKKKPQ
jgi:AsmA protein